MDYDPENYSHITVPSQEVKVFGIEKLSKYFEEFKRAPQLKFELDIINYLPREVLISTRDGMRYVIKPRAIGFQNIQPGLYFVKRAQVDDQHVRYFTDVSGDDGNPDNQQIRSDFETGTDHQKSPGGNITHFFDSQKRRSEIVYQIDERDLRQHPRVYLRNLDITVCYNLREFQDSWITPGTRRADNLQTKVLNFINEDEENRLSFFIEIINNGRQKVPNYVNLGGFVYRVPVKQDLRRRDGIYISGNNAMHEDFSSPNYDPEVRYYEFGDNRCPCRFWHTVKDALELGKPEALREAELNDAKQKASMTQLKQKEQIEWLKYATYITPIVIGALAAMFQYLNKEKK